MDVQSVVWLSTLWAHSTILSFPQHQPLKLANCSFVPFVKILWCASNSYPYSFFTPPPSFSFLSLPPPSFPSQLLAFVLLDPTDLLLPLYFANGFHMWRTRHFIWKCTRLLVGPIRNGRVHGGMLSVFFVLGLYTLSLPFVNMNFYLSCVNKSMCTCLPLCRVQICG